MKRIILKTAKKKQTGKKSGGIFYAILFVAIVTVGTTAYVMRTRNDALTELAENHQPQVVSTTPDMTPIQVATVPDEFPDEVSSTALAEESQWQSDDVIPVTETPESSNMAEPEESTDNTDEIPEITSLIAPVNGSIIKPHSDTELSYSKTMEDWRLHKGADIGAPIGATVIASGKGKISECYTDTATGVTIIIDHGNGLMTKYSNMASDEMVEVGQQVESGTVIGVVGDTAEFEVADEAHLHFEVIKDGRIVDPEEYLD